MYKMSLVFEQNILFCNVCNASQVSNIQNYLLLHEHSLNFNFFFILVWSQHLLSISRLYSISISLGNSNCYLSFKRWTARHWFLSEQYISNCWNVISILIVHSKDHRLNICDTIIPYPDFDKLRFIPTTIWILISKFHILSKPSIKTSYYGYHAPSRAINIPCNIFVLFKIRCFLC